MHNKLYIQKQSVDDDDDVDGIYLVYGSVFWVTHRDRIRIRVWVCDIIELVIRIEIMLFRPSSVGWPY